MSAGRIDPAALLASLGQSEDRIVTNRAGDRVWLKANFLDGKHVGVTDCCPADSPCEYHGRLTHQAHRT